MGMLHGTSLVTQAMDQLTSRARAADRKDHAARRGHDLRRLSGQRSARAQRGAGRRARRRQPDDARSDDRLSTRGMANPAGAGRRGQRHRLSLAPCRRPDTAWSPTMTRANAQHAAEYRDAADQVDRQPRARARRRWRVDAAHGRRRALRRRSDGLRVARGDRAGDDLGRPAFLHARVGGLPPPQRRHEHADRGRHRRGVSLFAGRHGRARTCLHAGGARAGRLLRSDHPDHRARAARQRPGSARQAPDDAGAARAGAAAAVHRARPARRHRTGRRRSPTSRAGRSSSSSGRASASPSTASSSAARARSTNRC